MHAVLKYIRLRNQRKIIDCPAKTVNRNISVIQHLPQRALIDLAAARAPFIDQSQSLNLFMAAPTIGKLSSMYLHAWKSGLKTTYYLRSRPATRIQQATVGVPAAPAAQVMVGTPAAQASATDAVACSLENPETCEACQ